MNKPLVIITGASSGIGAAMAQVFSAAGYSLGLVKSLSEPLRMANAKYGIRVCNIAPEKIATFMLIAAKLHDDQAIPAGELAKAVL